MEYTREETIGKLRTIYHGMKNRCYNESHESYAKYGARGITICDEWMENINSFLDWSMDNGYKYEPENGRNKWSIDRIDNDKGYSPDNCRWTTASVQCANRDVRSTKKEKAGLEKYIGIKFAKTSQENGKYIVKLTKDYTDVTIGRFDTLQEAVDARNLYIINNDLLGSYSIQPYEACNDNKDKLIEMTPFVPSESRYEAVDNDRRLIDVYQFTLDGELIAHHDSIAIAVEATDGKALPNKISDCINGKGNSSGGFRWSRTREPNEMVGKCMQVTGSVYVYKDEKLVDTMENKKVACDKYGISKSTMTRITKNHKKKNGYVFSMIDNLVWIDEVAVR